MVKFSSRRWRSFRPEGTEWVFLRDSRFFLRERRTVSAKHKFRQSSSSPGTQPRNEFPYGVLGVFSNVHDSTTSVVPKPIGLSKDDRGRGSADVHLSKDEVLYDE